MNNPRYSQIRKLARQYADHELSREDYLARRRTLVGAITSGKIALRYSGLQDVAPIPGRARFGSPLKLVSAAIVMVLAIAAGLHFLNPPPPAAPMQPAPPPERHSGPGVALVQSFVTAGDWSESSIVRFETQMLQLTPRQRANLRQSVWFRRLSAELARQITEQEAMVPLDSSGKAKQRAETLKAFAARLQIDPDA